MNEEDNMIIFQTLANLKFLDEFVVALNDDELSKQTLVDFYRKWLQEIEWTEQSTEEYSLMNQGVILTSLYGTIVYPKEKFYTEIPETPLANLESNKWGIIEFIIPNQLPQDMTLRKLVSRLRNALSHSRVELRKDPELDIVFTFKDGPDQQTVNFEVKMGVHEVHKFIFSLNKGLIKGEWD